MVKVNELRVGNLVYNKVGIETVTGMTLVSIEQGSERMPIPLTPEILGVAGFEEIGFGNGPHSIKYQKDYLIIFFDTIENAAFFCYYKDENRKKGRTIKNLHDFQNFYFGLTGEELTINQLQQV